MGKKRISIIGSTGSIGTQALEVLEKLQDKFEIIALAGGHNKELLDAQAKKFKPKYTVLGEQGLEKIRSDKENDIILVACSGKIGLRPTLTAIKNGINIALANKETLVMAGDIVMKEAKKHGVKIIPVDSEHCAIHQCIKDISQVDKLIITASGGPFLHKSVDDMKNATVKEALAHPKWHMGKKITVDSATLMNKGLEIIEAHHLFNKSVDDIGVVIHPQSIVHSMVEFADGAVIAQLGTPSMKTPIAYCLGYPQRIQGSSKRLSLPEIGRLDFSTPDMKRFPQLAYAYEAARRGQKAAVVLNAANEAGVAAFLESRAGFVDIARVCRAMLDAYDDAPLAGVPDIAALDAEVRARAQQWLEKNRGQSAAC